MAIYPEFKTEAYQDMAASERLGRAVFKEREVVNLHIDSKTVVPRFVDAEWLSRNPQFKEHYDRWKAGYEGDFVNGTPIREWAMIPRSMAEECYRANVRSVEDLAEAHDNILSKLGPGARALKAQAQEWLEGAKTREEIEASNAELRAEIEELKSLLKGKSAQKPDSTPDDGPKMYDDTDHPSTLRKAAAEVVGASYTDVKNKADAVVILKEAGLFRE